MSQVYCTRRRTKGTHLTFEDREELEYIIVKNDRAKKADRLSMRQIATRLGVSAATISRELKRGRVVLLDSELREYVSYSALLAQGHHDYQATAKGPQLKIGANAELIERIEELIIHQHFSPYAVVARLKQDGWFEEESYCVRTIYNYIEKNVFAQVTKEHLPRKGKNSKRRYTTVTKRIHDPEAKRINERPPEANDRSAFGHWEMDCIQSGKRSKTCLLVLVERKTRKTLTWKMRAQTQKEVQRCLDQLEKKLGAKRFRELFLSITVDNGGEFLDWRTLERSCMGTRPKQRTTIYFCHPYHSWERGTNEQVNGHLRRFIPKGCDISDFTMKQINQITRWLNDYPRKILEGLCANDLAPACLLLIA